jgi:hypothetical protein
LKQFNKHLRRTLPARYHENFPGLNFDGMTLREIREKVRGRDEEPPPIDPEDGPGGVDHDSGSE